MQTAKKIFQLLTKHERKRGMLLLGMIFVMAFLDMIGVASILPFIAVLTNQSLIESNLILNKMYLASSTFGVNDNNDFLYLLGVIVFFLIVTSLLFKLATTYAQVRFVQMREYSIGKRLVEKYLNQPYEWFLNRHSADLGKTILSEVGQVVGYGINPLIELIAKGMITFALIVLLVLTDPKLAIIVGFFLGTAYGIIFYFVRNFLKKIGTERLRNNQLRFTSISEAFGAAKEVKVAGLEKNYLNKFSISAQNFARTVASSQSVSQLPRFILEAISFGGIMMLILYLMSKSGSFNSALPIISLYAFAGYRLMPALQQIYSAFTQLTYVGPSLDKLYEDLNNLKVLDFEQDQIDLSLKNSINLKNVEFNYPKSSRIALKNINLKIKAKSKVGLVGATGSGKTTLVDIILGLLQAQKGTLEIDGENITKKNVKIWQKKIGYVPQNIYLSDDTVAANIAFGLEYENIDYSLVKKVSKIANLDDFVLNELPNKYETKIGERGVRLSGGQRQRIGIARALYQNPQVLVLDEATSALDNITEKAVMEEINNLSKEITIIIIAHRLSTVKKCDKIFLLEKGIIKNEGTFEELKKLNKNFFQATIDKNK